MYRKCPKCGSGNVRRSSFTEGRPGGWLGLLSPYRCRDCDAPFRVVSQTARVAFLVIVVVVVVSGLVAVVWAIVSGSLSDTV